MPAAAIADADGLARLRPVLARLAERGAPLLVHPGPAPWTVPAGNAHAPAWWPAFTRQGDRCHAPDAVLP